MPEREKAESLSLEEERHDPGALYRILMGGRSAAAGRRFAGLGEQILKRITEIYALPSPKGYQTDSRARGEERWEPRGQAHDADALKLATDLSVWLGKDPPDPDDPVPRDELLMLARRATRHATNLLRKRRGRPPPLSSRAHVLALVQTYIVWLGRSCDHKNAQRTGRVSECPDCGVVRIDL